RTPRGRTAVRTGAPPWLRPAPGPGRRRAWAAQLDALLVLTALPTVVKVALALVPSVVMAAMHTTMISASMTAYSTAVGPSSRFRNSTADWVNRRMCLLLSVARPSAPAERGAADP